ncbi:hypothetical protein ACGFNX_38525 [Streptomyces sp. NPDC048723]|uniref:hypothetical protein n=1 Tax=Streptomyces sp. NPDC048723 TaxID=3365589 RepID=UPI003718BC83
MIRTRIALAAAVASLALVTPVAALATDSAVGAATTNLTAAATLGEKPVVTATDDMIWQ